MKSHLAVIESLDEMDKLMQAFPGKELWVSARKRLDGAWYWEACEASGSEWLCEYTPVLDGWWHVAQPTNSVGYKYTYIYSNNHGLKTSLDIFKYIICKYRLGE